MAKGISINIKGLNETLSKLKDTKDIVAKEIDFAIAANVETMATKAKQSVPVDTGRLKNSISVLKNSLFNYTLVAQADYAAYVEFGTGNLFVQLPEQYWNDLADQFKAKPRKRLVNLMPRPYLRPSVLSTYPQMIEDINQVLKQNKDI